MDKNYGEMTMAELKAELVKKQNELAEVHKVVKPLHEFYVEDMTKYMTNKVREELLQTQRKVRTIYWDINKIDRAIRALERNAKREEVMKNEDKYTNFAERASAFGEYCAKNNRFCNMPEDCVGKNIKCTNCLLGWLEDDAI